MYKLYYAPGTCALASHIALEESGADYSAIRLDFKANQQQSPDYLKINAKGRVPALVTGKGIITETPAILAYVAQTFSKAKLAPLDDPFACAQGPRLSLGDAGVVLRRHEGDGAEKHGRLHGPGREGHAEGAVGDGRAVHDLRSLSLHYCALARGRQRG